MLSRQEWHNRYLQQARWTSTVRRFLFQQVAISSAQAVLEVGCGSGAILADLKEYTQAITFGIDIDFPMLAFARAHAQETDYRLACADGLLLPFSDRTFSISFCHYYLLWVSHPLQAVLEMARVTRPGGTVLAMAEPDYGGRIDYPEDLAAIGRMQSEALLRQGADPSAGRKLKALFHQAGLNNVEAGVLGGQWGAAPDAGFQESEWKTLECDLSSIVRPEEMSRFKSLDAAAWQNGERILYVPTFFAWGQV